MFKGILPRILGLTVVAVLPLATHNAGMLWDQWQQDRASAFNNVRTEARYVAAIVDDELGNLVSVLSALLPVVSTDSQNQELNDDKLRRIKDELPPYVGNILLFDADGQTIGTSGEVSAARIFVGDRDFFQSSMGGARLAIGPPVRGRTTGNWFVTIARPITGNDGSVTAVLALGIQLERFHETLAKAILPTGSLILVTNESGIAVARSVDGASWVGRNLYDRMSSLRHVAETNGDEEAVWADGVTRITGVAKTSRAPWSVHVGIPRDIALATLKSKLISGVSVSLLTILAAIVLAVLLASRLARPLQQLTADARLLAVGDYSRRTQVNMGGEVGNLAETFNTMASSLEERHLELEQARQAATIEARERARLQVAEQQSKEMLAAIIDASPVAIVCTDIDRKITLWSSTAEQLFGYSAEETVGQGVKTVPPEYQYLSDDFVRRVVNGETVRQIEVKRRHKDGRLIDVEYSAAPLRDKDGMVHGVARTYVDISLRKATEAQLIQSQKMEAIGHLTGGIAHDFNNLLFVIIGNLDLLVRTACLDPEAMELVKPSLAAAMSGAELANGLVAFSRKQALQPVVIDTNNLISDEIGLLKRALGADITVRTEFADDAYSVFADPMQLQCALMNLSVNAKAAMPNGGTLTFRTYNTDMSAMDVRGSESLKAGDFVAIEVSDTGTGIAPENLSRIFEPFFSTKEVGKGTGLGLSMVYGFFKQSNGRISVSSELGKGTTFRMFLPRARAGEATGIKFVSAPTLAPGGETILVVDDDVAVRKVVTQQLAALGYATIEAGSAAEALEFFAADTPFDLLFTDVVMPGRMSGVDLARIAREKRRDLKVLLTSGYPDLKTRHESFQNITMIKKPYRGDDLWRALKDALAD